MRVYGQDRNWTVPPRTSDDDTCHRGVASPEIAVRQPSSLFERRSSLPRVQRVSFDRPIYWLRAGLDDLFANPLPSIAYGLLFSIGGDLILLASLEEPHLFMAALSVFFLLAPVLAAGLYELSRQRAAGRRPTFIDSVAGLQRSTISLALFGLVLAIAALFWEQATALTFALVADLEVGFAPFLEILTSEAHRPLMLAWLAGGACLALMVFAASIVTAPLILDRETDFTTATLTSLRVFAANPEAMLLWAATIAALILISFATLMVGLVFTMPVLAHATWHAYQELVK